MDEQTLNRVLYVLLAVVCVLFWSELRRTWSARQESIWDDRYIEAVRSSAESWQLGWRLEDLEARLHTQRFWAEALRTVGKAPQEEAAKAEQLLRVVSDEGEYYTLECAARPKKLVQVGPDEFRDMNDRCRAFSGLEPRLLGPQAVWQVVPLDGGEGAVGLRSMSNGKFLRVKAPPADAAFDAPWLLETVSPLPGLAERFELRQVQRRPAPERPVVELAEGGSGERSIVDDGVGLFGRENRRTRRLLDESYLDPLAPVHDDALDVSPSWARERRPPNSLGEDHAAGDAAASRVVDAAGLRAAGSQTVMIFSELMRGYLQCHGSAVSEPVRGFAGESVLDESEEYFFNLSWMANVDAQLKLLRASDHVAALTAKEKTPTTSGGGERVRQRRDGPRSSSSSTTLTPLKKQRIALVVPMTSRGTEMSGVDQSPLWFNLFASFVESVDWRKNTHTFTFYLGFDLGDPLYDTGDAWTEMRAAFKAHAKKALKWLGYGNWTVHRVVEGGDPRQGGGFQQQQHHQQKNTPPVLGLKLFHFDDTLGAPSQAVSGLARQATLDGADYIYQLNDDTILVSKDWVDEMIDDLRTSPLAPNLGVAGPLDTTNERILTHAFVHKTHVEIFNAMFPTAFRNWWSDDWISAVYGRSATFARRDVIVTHNVQSQKTGAWNRYDVDHNAQNLLHTELQTGFVTINTWLRQRGYPTMPLPHICGYSPMMTRIYEALLRHGL